MTEQCTPDVPTFEEVVATRVSRRTVLKAALVVGGGAAMGAASSRSVGAVGAGDALTFDAITPNGLDQITLPAGFSHNVVIRWGDPVLKRAPGFDLAAQTPRRQARQFGFNCDYTNYFPLRADHARQSHDDEHDRTLERGVLWVNHEYVDPAMMFPGYVAESPTVDQIDVELYAHGASVVEVMRRPDGSWTYDPSSTYNRRIHGFTRIRLTGPAAGDDRLKTADDPSGRTVLGMLNNCGGGYTAWGTVLTAEENFNQYFANANACPDPIAKANHLAYGIPGGASALRWESRYARFDVSNAGFVNEPFRFGWVVEVDPYDPGSRPKKRTALGRIKHEAAVGTVAGDGRFVVYMGDDERFQFLYKFVTDGKVTGNKAYDRDLLDSGTLYVARFGADDHPSDPGAGGVGEWLPLVWGSGPLTVANGFVSQADVLIRCRQAAAVLGATPMDRPEDVEISPTTGKVYMACTNNSNRTAAQVDGVNPRANNRAGHIVEIIEDGDDHTATRFAWNIFMLCGEPSSADSYFAGFDKSQVSRIGAPDNLAFDRMGNLWIATDGMPSALAVGGVPGPNDCIYAVPTEGADRGHLKAFLGGVVGCETASLFLTPDDKTLFVSIQHPGEGGSIAAPTSQWPSAATDGVARPSVIAAWRDNGRELGYGALDPDPEIPEFPVGGIATITAAGVMAGLIALRNRGQRPVDEA
jgi:hypothetical protein